MSKKLQRLVLLVHLVHLNVRQNVLDSTEDGARDRRRLRWQRATSSVERRASAAVDSARADTASVALR